MTSVPGRLVAYEITTPMGTIYHKTHQHLNHIKPHQMQVRRSVKAGLKSVVLINNAAWSNL